MQCLVLHVMKKRRHVKKLYCYILWKMSQRCFWIDNRLETFYILICIIAATYWLASVLIRFSSLHTRFPLTSPRFFNTLPKVQHTRSKNLQLSSATKSFPWRRTNTRKNHGYNAVADDLRRQLSSVVESAPARNKRVQNFEEVKNFEPIHTLRSLPDQGEDVCKVWYRLVRKCGFI
jgi:hypothetical protein